MIVLIFSLRGGGHGGDSLELHGEENIIQIQTCGKIAFSLDKRKSQNKKIPPLLQLLHTTDNVASLRNPESAGKMSTF
jgi:hypothetical protein